MTRTALLLACLAGLSGCAELGVVFVGANMATLIHADKTIPDLALSAQKDQDCSLLHAASNEPYCQPVADDVRRQTLADLAATRYCYRTLGAITCYERPDFMASAETRVRFDAGFPTAPAGTLARSAPPAAPAGAASGNPKDDPMDNPMDDPTDDLKPAPMAALPPLEPIPGLGPY